MTRLAPRQRGFSLVEMMVALVLGLIVMGAALRLFVGTRGSANLEDQLARQQEDARYAIEALALDARQAGFNGCRPGVNRLLADTADPLLNDLLYNIERPIEGFEFAGTAPGANYAVTTLNPAGVATNKWSNGTATLPGILKDKVLPGTDVLIVKQAALREPVRTGLTINDQSATDITLDGDPPDIGNNTLVVLSDCAGADLFQNTAGDKDTKLSRAIGGAAPGNKDAKLSHPYLKGADVYVFAPSVYYVGQGPRGEPGLYRQRFTQGDASGPQELVPGVENMQLLFGEDTTDADNLADTYVRADQVSNWGRVVSIKIALLMRTGADTQPTADTATYTLLGTTIDPPDARRVHRVATWTIALRNQTR